MTDLPPPPIPDTYWVRPGRFLAGEYPGAKQDAAARRKLRRLLEAGVSYFLDLTEEDESGLIPYAPLLRQVPYVSGLAILHHRMPVPDLGSPTSAEMTRILDTIDHALEEGHTVYVHCWGGIGRTGTVMGCYLVRHGMAGDEALAEIARLRAGTPDGWRTSPETPEQRAIVLGWGARG